MANERVTPMEPETAAEAVKKALRGQRDDVTVADAAARSGLALRDAERGLYRLLERYPSNLKATSEGELLFSFPAGLQKPRKELTGWHRFLTKSGRWLRATGRFLVRAWISVVMIGYALAFLAIIIGLFVASLSGNRDSDRGGRGIGGAFELGYVLLRVVMEALFWTFHPAWTFAPDVHPVRAARREKKRDGVPFYEKVNRFVFGLEPPPLDAREREQRMLVEIRRLQGRIGVSDVMRVLGMRREEAEPFLARLMLDYDGEVEVSDEGGITYRFPEVRKTAGAATHTAARPAAIDERVVVPPLTGNPAGSNFLVAALNGFNLLMALFAMSIGLTIADVFLLFEGFAPAPDGIALVLGVIPAVFSAAIFAMPLVRALKRPAEKKRAERENARRSVVRRVLAHLSARRGAEAPVDEGELKRAWQEATGVEPDDKELVRAVVELGGDVEVSESGRAQIRFRDLEAELLALERERAAAPADEAQVGDVVFAAEEVARR